MQFIFFANTPSAELVGKSLSGFHDFKNTHLICSNPKLVSTKNISNIYGMKSVHDIHKLADKLDDHSIIAPLGTVFNKEIENYYNLFDGSGLVTWGFFKNNVLYNKFSDSIKYNIIGLNKEAAKECSKDLKFFSILSHKHIPEILCNL